MFRSALQHVEGNLKCSLSVFLEEVDVTRTEHVSVGVKWTRKITNAKHRQYIMNMICTLSKKVRRVNKNHILDIFKFDIFIIDFFCVLLQASIKLKVEFRI